MTALHWAAFGLSAITGVVHIYLHYTQAKPVFPFAGAVFLGAGLAGLPNVYRRALYALGVPFTAGQIVIRALMGIPDMSIAIVDKPIQAALIVLLAYPFVDEKRLIQDRTWHDFRLYRDAPSSYRSASGTLRSWSPVRQRRDRTNGR